MDIMHLLTILVKGYIIAIILSLLCAVPVFVYIAKIALPDLLENIKELKRLRNERKNNK